MLEVSIRTELLFAEGHKIYSNVTVCVQLLGPEYQCHKLHPGLKPRAPTSAPVLCHISRPKSQLIIHVPVATAHTRQQKHERNDDAKQQERPWGLILSVSHSAPCWRASPELIWEPGAHAAVLAPIPVLHHPPPRPPRHHSQGRRARPWKTRMESAGVEAAQKAVG